MVNDGSTDNSLNICNQYKNDPRIVILNKKNGGVSKARNEGLKKATGDYVVFVDADDYISNDYIQNLIVRDSDLIISGYYTDYNGKIFKNKCYSKVLIGDEIYDNIFKKEYISLLVTPYLKIFKLSIIKKNDLKFNEVMNFGEDAFFVINYLKYCNRVDFVPNIGYYNVIVDGTLSRKYVKNMYEQCMLLYNLIDGYRNSKNYKYIDYWYIRSLKLVLYNEKYIENKSEFIHNIKEMKVRKNCSLKYFSIYDKVIYFLLYYKNWRILYFIYKYLR